MTNKHVLLIDDEEDIREIAQMSLEMTASWEVSVASSGSEGIERAKEIMPDAILLDVMMPDMDGITTFNNLQADPNLQKLPVIFLTAKVQPTETRTLQELGMGYISKPFDPLQLASQVAEILGWKF